ncbi:DUF3566 domain-containing protein [Mycobacterium sp. OTB74]|uniref:DUF3566 domain-containing protein n=1 Tax=Mycobacterium sp. OTB74 TaxID=1853452 RepID=UPI002474CC0F|nr:DUF3566 domain-containing protein [Mycobacterium sp. OTB74]MDH6244371.1 hypothetical protein [Mycobacterium sp. OTB74]
MSSPNEPGHARTDAGPTGSNGALTGAGAGAHEAAAVDATQATDAPPWQRGRARPAADGPRVAPPAGTGQSLDDRLNRFVSGGPAATHDAETTKTPAASANPPASAVTTTAVTALGNVPLKAAPPAAPRVVETVRTETRSADTYASELPDLSGPKVAQRRAAERAANPPARQPVSVTRGESSSRQQAPLRANMQVRRFDPWSVLKVSLVLSVALFFVWMIAVAFLYLVLGGMGVWSKLNSNVGDLLTSGGGSGGELVSAGTIFGGATLIGLVNIVLMTAMATTAAFVYNLTTDLVGGIEVTLADRD